MLPRGCIDDMAPQLSSSPFPVRLIHSLLSYTYFISYAVRYTYRKLGVSYVIKFVMLAA